MDNKIYQLTESELEEVIEKSVKRAFVSMGIDVDNPVEVQRDMQHLRDWRMLTDAIRTKGIMTIVGIIVAGACAALWVGVKMAVKGG